MASSVYPLSDRTAFLLKIAECQKYKLHSGIIGWEATSCFGGFANDAIQAFNRICRIDKFAHGWREGEERDHFLPCASPRWCDGRIFAAPFSFEISQCFFCRLVIRGVVDLL